MAQIRRHWPKTRILLRGDFGFARETLMAWFEANRVDFLFGLARNERLELAIKVLQTIEQSPRLDDHVGIDGFDGRRVEPRT